MERSEGVDPAWMRFAAITAVAIAYRDLWIEAFGALVNTPISTLVFIPGSDTLLVGLACSGFIVWHRRGGLSPIATTGASTLAAGLAALALALFVWSSIVQAPELLLASLAALLLAVAQHRSGSAGTGRMIFPAVLLLLTLPLPAPLEGEIVWALQKTSATLTAGLLELFGQAASLEATTLRTGGIRFDFLEASSGLRLIQILFPVALGFGAAYGFRNDRLALYLLLTTTASFALNIVRILIQISSGARAATEAGLLANPSVQAIGCVVLGLAVLYAIARALAAPGSTATPTDEGRGSGRGTSHPASARPSLIVAVALAVASVAVASPFDAASSSVRGVDFPVRVAGWTGANLPLDYNFPYTTSRVALTSRSYVLQSGDTEKLLGSVEFFAASEARAQGGVDRLPASKLPSPGVDWHPVSEFASRTDLLDRPVRVSEFARNEESEFMIVYSWRVRDAGIVLESLRSLSGIDRVRWSDAAPRTNIRLSTTVPSQLRSDRRRAMRRLDRFVTDFRAELEAL